MSLMRRIDPGFEKYLKELQSEYRKRGLDLSMPQITKLVHKQLIERDIRVKNIKIKKTYKKKRAATIDFVFRL